MLVSAALESLPCTLKWAMLRPRISFLVFALQLLDRKMQSL